MNDPEDEKSNRAAGESLWPLVLFLCGIAAVLFVAQQFEDWSAGTGRMFLGWFVGIGALLIFLNIIWGSTFRETLSNLKGITKAIFGLFVVVMIIGGIGQCSGSGSSGNGLGGVPDNWRK